MKRTIAIAITILATALPASAATDLGDGACQQTNGETGLWNGTTADDDGCVTLAEYETMYGDPVEIVVSVKPELEPDAPTVAVVFTDPFVRAELAGLSIE